MNLLRFQLFEQRKLGERGPYKLVATYRNLEQALATSQEYDWLLWDRFNQCFLGNDRSEYRPDPEGNFVSGPNLMHPNIWGIE